MERRAKTRQTEAYPTRTIRTWKRCLVYLGQIRAGAKRKKTRDVQLCGKRGDIASLWKGKYYLHGRLDESVRMFVDGNVEVHGSFWQLKPQQNSLAVQRSARADVNQENFRWMHSKVIPAVVQLRHRIADHHVGQFTDDFASGFFRGRAGDFGKI